MTSYSKRNVEVESRVVKYVSADYGITFLIIVSSPVVNDEPVVTEPD